MKMKNLNQLDRELIKADAMNTDAVRGALAEMADESIPTADYDRIRDKLFTNKRKPTFSRRYIQLAATAACAAVVMLCVWAIPGLLNNLNIPNNPIVPHTSSSENPAVYNPAQTINNPAQTTPSNPALSAENPNSTIKIAINEIAEHTSGSMMFALMWDDFIPMTYDEVMEYFAATIPVSDVLPDLKLQPKSQDNPYGIYSSDENGRGHYYDANQFLFLNENGSQSFSVTLEKVFFLFGYQMELENPDSLALSNINGRKLAVFHYVGVDEHDCYHVEFVQNGIAYCVQSSNLSQDNFIKGLTALVEKTEEQAEPRTLIGTVNLVDTYAGYIGIKSDVDQAYKNMVIHLPIGEAKDALFQKRVEIFYEGEPATVNQIWSQQFIGMNIIDE
jgi:hypothetical protein